MADNSNNKSTSAKNEAAKQALSHFGGPAGKVAADLARTKAGQAAINNMANNSGGGLVNPARNLNLINAARRAKKAQAEGSDGEGNTSLDGKADNSNKQASTPMDDKQQATTSLDNPESEQGKGSAQGEAKIKIPPKAKIAIAGGALSILGHVLIIVLVISIIYSVADVMKEAWDGLVSFFTKDQAELEEEYYLKLRDVQRKRYQKEHVCIDVNLITAALTVDTTFEPDPNEANKEVLPEDNEEADTETGSKKGALDYKRMKKQIELLANMQIKHVVYGWDNSLDVVTDGHYCKPSGSEESEEVVDDENKGRFSRLGHTAKTSTDPEIVSQNDEGGFLSFFLFKADKEKNYEYRLHQPVAVSKCMPEGSANCTYQDVCSVDLAEDEAVLSIGDPDNPLNTMEEGVFYWNLVHQFIKDYYSEYLPEDEEARDKKIHSIAESIFLLYKSMGPSHECTMYDKEDDDDGGSSTRRNWTDSELCPDGIMVKGKDGTITTHYLEEYVAGVVAAENAWHQGDNIESMKAQAIAARSYALSVTHGCTTVIKNGQSHQAYKKTDDPYCIRAAQETAGVVLRKPDGSVYFSEYDAFCVSKYFPATQSYTIRQRSQSIPKSFVDTDGTFCKGTSVPEKCGCNGHGHGMSQIGARYLQFTGSDHKQILSYYYIDAVLDESKKGTGVGGGVSGPWEDWKQGQEPWRSMKAKGGCELEFHSYGCFITSVVMLIARSGVPTTLDPDFNPGTAFQVLSDSGAIASDCNTTTLQPIFDLTNGAFRYVTTDTINYNLPLSSDHTSQLAEKVKLRLDQGYQVQIWLKEQPARVPACCNEKPKAKTCKGCHFTHYVAVRDVSDGQILIADPGSSCTVLNNCYSGRMVAQLRLYKGG